MLLASTESSPVEPVSFTRSLPARSTKHSVPCLLGQALGWGTSIGGVMLWPPSHLPCGPPQCPNPSVWDLAPCCSLHQCILGEEDVISPLWGCLHPQEEPWCHPPKPSPPCPAQDTCLQPGCGCGWSEERGCGSSAC